MQVAKLVFMIGRSQFEGDDLLDIFAGLEGALGEAVGLVAIVLIINF